MARNSDGSYFCSHSSLGAVKPGMAWLPVMARDSGTSASSSTHSAKARVSFHKMAARSSCCCLSSSVAPCIWPDSAMPRKPENATGWALRMAAITSSVACHQSSGFCSDQPGCGLDTRRVTPLLARMVCASSARMALTSEVPISIPR